MFINLFIVLVLYMLIINITDNAICMQEHPNYIQKTVPKTEFKPVPLFEPSRRVCNLSTITNIDALNPYLELSTRQLNEYSKDTLLVWKSQLYKEITTKMGGMVKKDGTYVYDLATQLKFFNQPPYDPTNDPTAGNYFPEPITRFREDIVRNAFIRLDIAKEEVHNAIQSK